MDVESKENRALAERGSWDFRIMQNGEIGFYTLRSTGKASVLRKIGCLCWFSIAPTATTVLSLSL
jgi:hypothetical protein